MALNTISFRQQTISAISDIFDDEKLDCGKSQKLISYIAGKILNYKEEGHEVDIKLLFCENITTILSYLPGSIYYKIGEAALDDEAGKIILKDCAPLCSRNWTLYISRISEKRVEYGVFSFEKSPTSLSLVDSISLFSSEFAILVHRVNVGTIEIIGSKGSNYQFEFSTVRQETAAAGDKFEPFAKKCSLSIPEGDFKEKFIFYLANLIREAAISSHGTILICCEDFEQVKPEEVSDVILIEPRLDFLDAFSNYIASKSAESITHLNRLEDLLSGFVSCDGIVVFDTLGGVVAYRGFFRSAAAVPAVVGGARRRAFEGIRQLVGPTFVGALFQSQDGLTIYEGKAP